MHTTILKGNIIHTPTPSQFVCLENGYLVAADNKIKGIFKTLPELYQGLPIMDMGISLSFPDFATCIFMHLSLSTGGWDWICS